MARRLVYAGGAAAVALAGLTWLALRRDAGARATAAALSPVLERTDVLDAGVAPEPPAGPAFVSMLESPIVAERQPVQVLDARRTPLRGQVVDSRTGQGLPLVEVALQVPGEKASEGSVSGLDGYFGTIPAADPREHLRARDRLTGKVLARRRLGSLIEEAGPDDAFVWPVPVGPTLVVRLRGAPEELRDWRLRLLERAPAAGEHAWEWREPVRLERDGSLVARYRDYEREPSARSRGWVQVVDPSETWRGEEELESTLGVHAVEIQVEPVAAALGGRVVDERGQPVRATLIALRRGVRRPPDASWPEAETSDHGTWRLIGLEPGPTRLLVFSDHRPIHRVDVALARGESETLEIVLQSLVIAGDIQGVLVGPAGGEEPVALLHLESADGGGTSLMRTCFEFDLFEASKPDGRAPFSFDGLPAGRYRLTVLALDGRRYAPNPVLVEPPTEIEIATEQGGDWGPGPAYSLELTDAGTGARLREPRCLYHLAPFWSGEVESGDPIEELAEVGEGSPLSLVVGHIGYRPAFLHLPDAYRSARRTPERVEVELALEPGWGAALIVLDAEQSLLGRETDFSEVLPMRGLSGARIVSGGRTVGTSDHRGLALCQSDGPIEHFDVELRGWSVLAVDRFRGHSETPDGFGFVLMARD